MPLIHEALASSKLMWSWVVALFQPVDTAGTKSRNLGVTIGQAIGGAIGWVMKLYAKMIDIPKRFIELGEQIVTGLTTGIARKIASARDAVVQLGSSVKGCFAQTLGIHSPSRVFMELGRNVGEGAQIGMLSTLGALRGAASRLADATTQGAANMRTRAALAAARHANDSASRSASSTASTIHFSPTIHVGSTPNVREQVDAAMKDAFAEFERMSKRLLANQTRTAY